MNTKCQTNMVDETVVAHTVYQVVLKTVWQFSAKEISIDIYYQIIYWHHVHNNPKYPLVIMS